jgi:hypothetical protein
MDCVRLPHLAPAPTYRTQGWIPAEDHFGTAVKPKLIKSADDCDVKSAKSISVVARHWAHSIANAVLRQIKWGRQDESLD